MTFGGLEYAWAFMKKAEISVAARAGARTASLEDSTLATVQATVSQQMAISGFPAGSWNLTIVPADPSSVFPGDPVTVSIVVNYSAVSLGGLSDRLPLPDVVNGHAVMRKEGDS
jgi:Flp pilus assembly protein TadG